MGVLGLAATANAACQFSARSAIFPSDLLTISEYTPDDTTDDRVQVLINFDKTNGPNNAYFMLDTAVNGAGGTFGTEDVELVGSELLFTSTSLDLAATHATLSCDAHACTATHNVAIMIGAAPDSACGAVSDLDHVYTRSIYKFQITKELARVDGVDVTNWAEVRTDSSFITQEDYDQDAVQTFDAQNVEVMNDFTLTSSLALTGEDSNGMCLGEGASAALSGAQADSGTVSHNNSLVAGACQVTAFAQVVHDDPNAAVHLAGNAAADDNDLSDSSHEYGTGYVQVHVSQYSQMGANASNGGEAVASTAPGDFSCTDDGAAKSLASGSDYRYDICRVKRSIDASGDDEDLEAETDANVGSSANSYTTGDVSAKAECVYTPEAPESPAAAEQSPIIYISAWFSEGGLDSDVPSGSPSGDYADGATTDSTTFADHNSRRLLRSAKRVLAAAPKAPAGRVHLLRVHLKH